MSGYLSRVPFATPSFEEIEPYFVGELIERSYTLMRTKFEALEGVVIHSLAYESDGLKVTGVEVLPEFAAGETGPLAIFNRGGSRNFGALSVPQIMNLMVPLTRSLRAGVLASNYRGNAGGEGQEEFGGAEVNDILRLIEIGKEQPWWDGKNIFLFGWSRGGMMTYLTLKAGAQVNAAAVGAGIANVFALEGDRMEKIYEGLIPGYPANREEAFTDRSAVCWPEEISAPLLLLHGDADKKVTIEHAQMLHKLLQQLDHPVKLMEYPGGGHGLMRENADVMQQVADWFTAYRR